MCRVQQWLQEGLTLEGMLSDGGLEGGIEVSLKEGKGILG